MKRSWTVLALLALMGFVPLTLMAQDTKSLPGNPTDPVTEAEMDYLVELCETCHGAGGNSTRPDVPSLAGRDADELFAEIERFYFYERVCPDVPLYDDDGSKGHMSMCDITSSINRQEGEALARHFEAQAVTTE